MDVASRAFWYVDAATGDEDWTYTPMRNDGGPLEVAEVKQYVFKLALAPPREGLWRSGQRMEVLNT